MALQNNIHAGFNNPVVILFDGLPGDGLNEFDNGIFAKFKDDERDSISNPTSVVINSNTQLVLFFGDTTETGSALWEIWGVDSGGNKTLLTGECICNLPRTKVC